MIKREKEVLFGVMTNHGFTTIGLKEGNRALEIRRTVSYFVENGMEDGI